VSILGGTIFPGARPVRVQIPTHRRQCFLVGNSGRVATILRTRLHCPCLRQLIDLDSIFALNILIDRLVLIQHGLPGGPGNNLVVSGEILPGRQALRQF